jgi:predicted Holliday junction resolvase-like endonuclease
MILYTLIGFLLVALILLIMRISNINEKLDLMDENLSDKVSHEYFDRFYELQQQKFTPEEMKSQVAEMKEKLKQNL